MKAWQRMALAAALLAALGLTGCQSKTNGNAQGNAQGNGPGGQGQFQQMQGTTGVVTDISDISITIAVMPQGQGFGGQGRPNGSGRPNSGPQGSAQPNQGQAPDASSRPTIDTSNWEKKTFTIDSSTKITQFNRSNGNDGSSQSTALKVSDIKAGESVNISERSSKAGTADTITVMGRSGFGGQGGRGQGAPNGQNQGNPSGQESSSSSKV